jgi:hypothetical protein
MQRSVNRTKVLGLLAAGSMLFQLGGCSIDAFLNQAQIGFARTFGGIPAQLIYDLTIGPLDLFGGGGEEEGT